jgi:[FeFe] hydrogenase H-cluster maturation GTPase HydF
MRNAGKSSLVNAVTGQELAVVSDVKGTTTDPVKKAMEILPLGPVVIIDTPGIDDEGELGQKRVQKAKQVLTKTDIAVLTVDSTKELGAFDKMMIDFFKEKNIPYIIAYNKADLLDKIPDAKNNEIYVSAKNSSNIYELKEKIASFCKQKQVGKDIVADIIEKGDTVVLVIPIDESAPKGRIILPQQQVLRELLDNNCTAVCCQVTELDSTIKNLSSKPKLVITDSQAFNQVAKIVPDDIALTSFSILFARYKGDLAQLVEGARQLKELKDGDTVLISEGCTHHRQCNDIGTVKLPGWIKNYTGKKLNFEFTSGVEFPDDLSKYSLVVHCGGCMLNETEMKFRISHSVSQAVKIVNYGVAIAQMNGILDRSIKPLNL